MIKRSDQHGDFHFYAHKRDLAADVDFFKAPKRDLTIMEMPAKSVMPNAHQCTPEAFDAVVDQIRPTINAAAVVTGDADNQRLSTLPTSVLKRARRRARQAQ